MNPKGRVGTKPHGTRSGSRVSIHRCVIFSRTQLFCVHQLDQLRTAVPKLSTFQKPFPKKGVFGIVKLKAVQGC